MRIYYIRFTGDYSFGAWRDEMQAEAWVKEMSDKYEVLTDWITQHQNANTFPEEMNDLFVSLKEDLWNYANEATMMRMKSPNGKAFVDVALYLNKRWSKGSYIRIDSFEIHDSFYGENLNRLKRMSGIKK